MGDQLGRLHRSLLAAASEWGRIESQGRMEPQILDAGGYAATGDHGEVFGSGFRVVLPPLPSGCRSFTVTITEEGIGR